ncbi:hypothetical protein E2C01_008809 [Portunus trituberculatus]|uniref:Uncharacterized protein n=1 Tax=Portunus trituberculatus TaxID=210409 RepID=A0A5B7D3Y6_PORTR|nr:hypothetical protein [Portunus trituberculatus]
MLGAGDGVAHSSKMTMGLAGDVVASVAGVVAGASCLHQVSAAVAVTCWSMTAVAGAEGEAAAGGMTGPTRRTRPWTAVMARRDGTEVGTYLRVVGCHWLVLLRLSSGVKLPHCLWFA